MTVNEFNTFEDYVSVDDCLITQLDEDLSDQQILDLVCVKIKSQVSLSLSLSLSPSLPLFPSLSPAQF